MHVQFPTHGGFWLELAVKFIVHCVTFASQMSDIVAYDK